MPDCTRKITFMAGSLIILSFVTSDLGPLKYQKITAGRKGAAMSAVIALFS
jgi:hypothetical protein